MKAFIKSNFERVITEESLAAIYHDTVLLLLAITLMMIFKEPIISLLKRINKHKSTLLGDNELSPDPNLSSYLKHKGANKGSKQRAEKASLGGAPELAHSAHFYWLGSDLMEAIRSVAVVPNKEMLIQSLSQSLLHFKRAGLNDDELENRMEWLIDLNKKKVTSEWATEQNRRDILNEVLVARDRISRIVKDHAGPGFDPTPN